MSRPFLYRCPVTGYQVQGSLEAEVPPPAERRLVGVDCVACGRIHIVDPVSGKLASETRRRPARGPGDLSPRAASAGIDPQK